MKRERRHELEHNDLIEWFNRVVSTVGPYANLILAVSVVAVLLWGGWTLWNRQTAKSAAGAWEEIYGAISSGNPAEVDRIAERRAGSHPGHWAAVVAADLYLYQGCQQVFHSKATAAQELRKAVERYLTVLKESRSPALRERASYGLARAYEALAGTRESLGELDKAIQYYDEVATQWPDGAYAQLAARRIEDLKSQQTRAFYDQFAQYDPQPAFSDQPAGGEESPSFDLESLDEKTVPDFSEALELEAVGLDAEEGAPGGDERAADSATSAETSPEGADDPPEQPASSPEPEGQVAPPDAAETEVPDTSPDESGGVTRP